MERLYAAELEAERSGWYEFAAQVRRLTPDECMEPGYYRNPDWSVRDLAAHVGTWLAEAQVQFERMIAGTYEGHDIDIDALNAALLEGLAGQPWEVAWLQANAGRTRMLEFVVPPHDSDRRGGVVDPQGGRRSLRGARRSPASVGGRARRPAHLIRICATATFQILFILRAPHPDRQAAWLARGVDP